MRVLAEDARYKHTRLRQGGVCKGLTRLAQRMGFFDLKGLEVENGQDAIHGRARPMARLPVVVVLDDVGAVVHTHELRVVRSLDLRRAHPHEPLHHEVPRQRRIPVSGQQAGCRGARLFLGHEGVRLRQFEARADDTVLFGAGVEFDVGGRHDCAVLKELKVGVPAVCIPFAGLVLCVAGGVVKQFDAVLALLPVEDVLEGADPGDVVAVGWARGRHVAEGDHQPPVRGTLDDVPVARECGG